MLLLRRVRRKTADALQARRRRQGLAAKAPLFLIGVWMLAASIFGGTASADAHANLLFASPAANSTVARAPSSLTLFLDEPVTIDKSPVTLTGPQGPVALGAASLASDRTSVKVQIPPGQKRGVYHVSWQVTAQDGDVMAGSYPFAVGPASVSLVGAATTETRGAWVTGILRGVLFAALALSLGEGAGRWLLRRVSSPSDRIRSWMPLVPIIGLGASVGLALALLGDGSLIAGLVHPTFGALTSRPGIVALIEVAGFALAAVASRSRRPGWSWLPLVIVIAAEALRAHPGIVNAFLGVPLTVIHLGSAALWAGTLVYVLRSAMARQHQPGQARAVVAAYSRFAIWLFVTVAVTGFGSALLLLPLNEIVSSDYGRVLLIKVILVALAAALAWVARRRLHRKAPIGRIRRSARIEVIPLVGVLALSAILTVLPPPADPNAPLPFAPPPTGPYLPVAALAGQVEINAQASAGQLVIQLDAPEIFNQAGQLSDSTAALTGALADPNGKVSQLTFRSCGKGCFFTAATWKNGSSRLTLSPTLGTWPVVETGLTVEWPTRPAGDLLAQAISATNAIPALTLYERVTANPQRDGLGAISTLPMSGTTFIRHSLFGSGKVPAIVRLPDLDGNSRLAISYPAEKAVDELTIAPDGKILSETLTSSDVVTNTLIYPESETGH